jgi:hypothetical protein
MAAVTRWVRYDLSAVGVAVVGGNGGVGQPAFSIGTASISDADGITVGPTTNRLYLNIDGATPGSQYITLYSGSVLDPRFIAKDITEKMNNALPADESWANAICRWENAHGGAAGANTYDNRFKIYSGSLGSGSSVTVATSGTNSAHAILGFASKDEVGGSDNNTKGSGNTSNFGITVSGTYKGFLPEMYTVVIGNDADATRGIGTPTKTTLVYPGTITAGGVFNGVADITYTVTIDVTNGTTMGQGTGNVPLMSWTEAGSDDSDNDVELLYPDHWYKLGTKGVMVQFTDAVFANGDFTLACYKSDYAAGSNVNAPVGTAQYIYASDRGEGSSSPTTTDSGTGYTRLGTRGLWITFSGTGQLTAGDEWRVLVSPPLPAAYNISQLNYGNVTVSTESDVKAVLFEVESGAIEMSSVAFGLQNNGSFSHHNEGNSDTYFRFGTVGPANTAGTGQEAGIEWYQNIAATDIDNDTPPSYLYATEDNLSVVATADASEDIGNWGVLPMADPIWVNIRLGASETGANSTINYRLYFDYS